MNLAENKAVVQELDELGNGTGDLSRLDALCTPDLVNHALAPHLPPGIEGTRQFLTAAARIAERWAILDDLTMILELGEPRQYGTSR